MREIIVLTSISLALATPLHALAQPQTAAGMDAAVDALERLADEEEVDADLLQDLQSILEDPVDLNEASADELVALPGVDRVLAERIVYHRDRHGPFRSVLDLSRVVGLPIDLAENLLPFTRIGPPASAEAGGAPRSARITGHLTSQLYRREEMRFPNDRGDSPQATRDSRLVSRLRVAGLGISGRLSTSTSDSHTRPTVGGLRLSAARGRFTVVAGMYTAAFGGGLVVGKAGIRDNWQYAGSARPIRELRLDPQGSLSASRGLRGLGIAVMPINGLRVAGIFSGRSYDGVDETLWGIAAEIGRGKVAFGATSIKSHFSSPLTAGSALHEQHRLAGQHFGASSVYARLRTQRYDMAAEIARDSGGQIAVVVSCTHVFVRRGRYVMFLRHIPARFNLLHAQPAGLRAPDGTGETGLVSAVRVSRGRLTMKAMADAFRSHWARSSAPWPAAGYQLRVELDASWKLISLSTQFDLSGSHLLPRKRARLQLDAVPIPQLEVRNRVELVENSQARGTEAEGVGAFYGFLTYQQLRWRPTRRFLAELRNTMFLAEDFAARLYVHESDVLYQPLLVTLTGKGMRQYLRVRLELSTRVLAEIKLTRFHREDVRNAAPGPPAQIRRTELRAQVRLRM